MKIYTSAKEAKALGFTHHGSLYGVPVWIDPDPHDFKVAVKCIVFEPLVDLIEVMEHIMGIDGTPFRIGAEI